jgi:hypothetical protein
MPTWERSLRSAERQDRDTIREFSFQRGRSLPSIDSTTRRPTPARPSPASPYVSNELYPCYADRLARDHSREHRGSALLSHSRTMRERSAPPAVRPVSSERQPRGACADARIRSENGSWRPVTGSCGHSARIWAPFPRSRRRVSRKARPVMCPGDRAAIRDTRRMSEDAHSRPCARSRTRIGVEVRASTPLQTLETCSLP